jgi:hypothetical protein
MDLARALNILEIDLLYYDKIDLKYLKTQYHKLSLKHHPDKNSNDVEATKKFQEIGEAYSLLKREISIINNTNETEEDNNHSSYIYMAHLFVDSVLTKGYGEFIVSVVKDIVCGCKTITVKLFENLDKERAMQTYQFLFKYKKILHIGDNILEKVRDIIVEKYKNVQIYILNPSIHDLFENNVYKLEIDNEVYYVPLWHGEVYFEKIRIVEDKTICDDIIVKCIPELPENITIDENNNLIVNIQISFTFSLLEEKCISKNVGERNFTIPIHQLVLKPSQTFIFKKCGISRIIDNDIYNVGEKADVIFQIEFIQ